MKKEERVTVKIPAGIAHGQTISIQGQGEAGAKGAPAGDLYVHVRVSTHQKFTREGNDIFSIEHVPFTTAVLGGKIEIDTIDGKVLLKIPAGTQSGENFRIKGKGVPDLHGGGTGNQLVKVVVSVPKSLNKEQRRMLEELREIEL